MAPSVTIRHINMAFQSNQHYFFNIIHTSFTLFLTYFPDIVTVGDKVL